MDSQTELQMPILDGAIRSVNFFNGRLLTARDLTREQTANREVDRRLGQAAGDGVVCGLEVSKPDDPQNEAPVVVVEKGLAVNRNGQTLWLRDQTKVALVRKASATAAGIFTECLALQSGTYVAGAGVYLLTVAPAETREGRAVMNSMDTGTAPCNTDAVVSAVQFRLIQLDPPITTAELGNENYLRNLIAYKCFGVADTEAYITDPFGTELTQYGLLDGLRSNSLTDCDVPLAVLYWTLTDGIKFIDNWSVRRRLTHRSAAGHWTAYADERRMREGEAMFLQFQEQLEALAEQASPSTLVAKQHFNFLPPIGAIPHTDSLSGDGFDYRVFFSGLTYREPVFIEGAKVEQLFRRSQAYLPTDLNTGEMVWLYWVTQNIKTIDDNPAGPPGAYLIFTSGHVPYQGQAQYDLAHWDYGNYAI